VSRRDGEAGLTPDLLLRAYAAGIFPMAESREDDQVFWVDPQMRGILPLDAVEADGAPYFSTILIHRRGEAWS